MARFLAQPLWRLGFRPFYLLAGLFAPFGVLVWLAVYGGWWTGTLYPDPLRWHGHEMLFGFTMAVMAGFLLTATANWTGRPTAQGGALAALAALWCAGRLALLLVPLVPAWCAAAIDLAFLPALALAIGWPLWQARNRRNAALPLLLLALAGVNLAFHLDAPGRLGIDPSLTLLAGLDLVLLVMAIIGGRVVPAFTANALPEARVRRIPWAERLAVPVLLALVAADLLAPAHPVTGIVALAAALIHAARMARWGLRASLGTPILWILHVGYGWIVIYLALRGLAVLVPEVPLLTAMHAFAVGAIGSMTLAMMTRSALGHTGRPLVAGPAIVIAYLAVNLAALLRVLGPILRPDLSLPALVASGLLWTLAFVVFVVDFAPILTGPRINSRPG